MKYLLLLLLSTNLYAWEPDYVVSQAGGYVGMLTGGVGYNVTEHYSAEAILGYTLPNLHSLAIKNTLHPEYWSINGGHGIRFYTGLTILYLINNKDTYVRLPPKYPRRYYPMTAIRTAPYIGYESGNEEEGSIYVEVTALDHYLEAYVRSEGMLRLEEVTTWAIGLKKSL